MRINTASGNPTYLEFQAQARLVKCLRMIAIAAGVNWTADNDNEVANIVTAIIRTAYLIAQEKSNHDHNRNR